MSWRDLRLSIASVLFIAVATSCSANADWRSEWSAFREAVLQGNDAQAAQIGDGFIEDAAVDLNYHNPEFGRIALAVGSAHHRTGNFDRAAELVGQAHAAFQFANGYSDREAFDALSMLADITLDAKDYDRAQALYQEVLTIAVIGEFTDDIPGLLVGLAETYDTMDPRIAENIRASKRYPKEN